MISKDMVRFWLMVMLVSISLLLPLSLWAQQPAFTDTFDDPARSGWEYSSEVSIDDVLFVSAPGFAFHGGEWGDLTLTVQVQRLSEGDLVISYRASDAGAYHVVLGSDFLVLQREVGPVITELGSAAPLRIPFGDWLQVSVTAIGESHQVALNGQPVLTTTDPDPLPPGGVAFEALGEAVGAFDDLVVTVIGEGPVEPPQPQRVNLNAVEPPEGRPGQELELILLGSGFGDAAEVRVAIGGIEVLDSRIESDETIIAHILIPGDAPPGPRPVEIVAVFRPGEEVPAGLEQGFFVFEREPPFAEKVEPQQVRRGSQVELNVFGGNFLPEVQVEIGGEGVLVHRVEFVNAEHLRTFVEVTDSAPLGWRTVIVINPDEKVGEQERILEVMDEGPPLLGRPVLYEVEPLDVEQGREVELTLFGESFAEETSVLIHGGGVEVREFRFVDPSRLTVRVAVSTKAEPGPRLVELITAGGKAELPDGLIIVERDVVPPPTLPLLPELLSSPTNWVWAGASILLSGLSFTVGRALSLKSKLTWTDKARLQWQVEAENKLPKPNKICQWACKTNVSTDLLDQWRVTAIELTPLPLSRGKTPSAKRVKNREVLGPLNDLAGIKRVLYRRDEVRHRLAPVVDALLAQIMVWEQEGQTPASIGVEAKLETSINTQFGLYHCVQTKKGLDWGKPRLQWQGKLNQPEGEFLGVLRGPTAGEPDFTARARREMEACLLDLVSVARFRL